MASKTKKKLSGYFSRKNPEQAKKQVMLVAFLAAFAVLGVYSLLTSHADSTGPDLVVTAITTSPAAPTSGQAVTFSATIKNQGTADVPSGTVVGVSFMVDGTKVTWNESNTSGLTAGSSVTLAANTGTSGATWLATNGPHAVVATADDTGVIAEANEANNTLTQNLTIGSTGNMYLTPASTSVAVNNSLAYNLRITPGIGVEGVNATITYDATKLQFVSLDTTNTAFTTILANSTATAGTISISQGSLSGDVTADALIAVVNFKALAGSGSSTLQLSGNAAHNGVYTNPTVASATVSFTTPDTTAPTTSISSVSGPSAGVVVGTATITAAASDNVGVSGVQFYVDGVLKTTDTSSPYTYALDTTALANGSHTLQVKAYDAAGNVGSSGLQTVTVKNRGADINQDGVVNLLDFSLLASKYGQTSTSLGRVDINGDGTVNLLDFSLLANQYGT